MSVHTDNIHSQLMSQSLISPQLFHHHFSLPPQTLSQSMRQADLNFEKLKTESERLEQHTKKSVNWLLWLMLILVSFTFISMILFIRIFPRLR